MDQTQLTVTGIMATAVITLWGIVVSSMKECKKDRDLLRADIKEQGKEIGELKGKLGAASAPCGLPNCPKESIMEATSRVKVISSDVRHP